MFNFAHLVQIKTLKRDPSHYVIIYYIGAFGGEEYIAYQLSWIVSLTICWFCLGPIKLATAYEYWSQLVASSRLENDCAVKACTVCNMLLSHTCSTMTQRKARLP